MSGQDIVFKTRQEEILWWKTVAFDKGISPNEYNNSKLKDLKEIFYLRNVIEAKKARERRVQDLRNKMRK